MGAEPSRVVGSCSIDDMLSLEEISDRLEIQQLLGAYSTAIDQKRSDDLDHVFTPDAYVEDRAVGSQPNARESAPAKSPRSPTVIFARSSHDAID